MFLLKSITLHQISLLPFLLVLHLPSTTLAAKSNRSGTDSTTKFNLNSNLNYDVFPIRSTDEAAVVEWGNSAIISALDAAVATFGPQTSRGAFFEVETAPVLANPINAIRSPLGADHPTRPMLDEYGSVPYPGALVNSDEVEGNMLVMTNDNNLSGVAMARVAKESGAAALMVVNLDEEAPDYIYSLEPESDAEAEWAEENIDIPVIMVSLGSGNLITTATVEEGTDEKDIVNNGMPDRVRLYAAGDRPFFEDVSHEKPVLYLIHNLLTADECDMLMTSTQGTGMMEPMDDGVQNLLESTMGTKKAVGVEGMMIWKGQTNGHLGKQIEERIEQVTGYPNDHFSDWQITRYANGARHELDYDRHPIHSPVATITVFLNELPTDNDGSSGGGEIIYPQVKDIPPIKITPQRGMAVVHHNTDQNGVYDSSALNGHLPMSSTDSVKYVAKKYVYSVPLPTSHRIILPTIAAMNKGKLPRWVRTVHDALLEKFGFETGTMYFEKLCTICPIFILFMLANVIGMVLKRKFSEGSGGGNSTEPLQTGKKDTTIGGDESGTSKKKRKKKKEPLKAD